jgi:hypothetical protein
VKKINYKVSFSMNAQRPFLFVVGVLLALSSNAEEKNSTQNSFPPNDFSVEKSTEASTTKSTGNIANTDSAISGKNTNPWGTPISAKVEKQYPPAVKKGMQVPVPSSVLNVPPPYNRAANFQQPNVQFPPTAFPPRNMGYQMPNTNFSNMSPFGNSFSPNSFFNNGTMPTPWSNTGGVYPWRNNNNSALPPFFPNTVNTGRKKAWGDIRHIWPDFYTDFTDEAWDKSMNAPYEMGRMPGGWRAPSLSSPDPVTVGVAVTNLFPPMLEEMGNMMNFAN